jgi:hypothetical protein
MKSLATSLLSLSLATLAVAQTPAPEVFIKGESTIRFNTRTATDADGKPQAGITDKYMFSVNVANSVQLRGSIDSLPYIHKLVGSSQEARLDITIESDVVNPKNPKQTRNVGRIYGTVPVDQKNVYRYTDGNLKQVVFPVGTAKGFESNYKGLALGKPPASSGFLEKLKSEAMNVTKMVKGQAVTIAVTKFDKMEFQDHVLGSGPVQIYPDATVKGSMIYDYGRTAWYFDNVTVTYALDGKQLQDKLTGNIRWVESPNRSANGEGEYQFDIRVNEPAQTEAAAFAGPTDESAFFATDDAIAALTGVIKYKDTINDETVTSSALTIDLVGNKLTKQQAMYLAKLLFVSLAVPLNSE